MTRALLVARASLLLGAAALYLQSPALAQYTFDPANEDEIGVGIRYFGAAKDASGALIQGATILITNKTSTYVFVTDNQGRFRGHLPVEAVASKVSVKCFKADFAPVRVDKRSSPVGGKPAVQVDCVLRAAAAVAPTGG